MRGRQGAVECRGREDEGTEGITLLDSWCRVKAVGGPGLSVCQNEVGRRPISPFSGSVEAGSEATQPRVDFSSVHSVECVAKVQRGEVGEWPA
jgi:hypothetical protein